jgi:MSHA biogenesis protein MshE
MLGSIMVEQGWLRPEQLEEVFAAQQRTGQKLGQALVDSKYVTDEQVVQAIAIQLGITYVDLRRYEVDPETAQLIDESQARRFRALVLEDRGETYLVGVIDPWDLRSQDEVAFLLKRPIEVAVITDAQLLLTIDRIYRKTEQIGEFAREVEREIPEHENVIDLVSMGRAIDDADAPVVKLLQTIFDDAARINASDIHFEPEEKTLVVRFRIDGVLHPQVQADARIASTLIVRLKLLAGMDISERRLPQDGRLTIKSGDSSFDIRMSTMPTQYGESAVLRLLRKNPLRRRLSDIIPARVCQTLERAIHSSHGIVLVTGPTGSGKTTTLYAALEELNQPSVKILTCEDPVEYRLAGITQVQVNEKIDLSFARVLRSFLRQDPDILLVGEIRDNETADIAVRAAMTGHMVLATLHTNDAQSTPVRLLDMGVAGYMIASTLLAVMSQRLLRVICTHCSEPVAPPPDELAWVKHHVSEEELSGARIRRGRGCVRCHGMGYFGRQGVFEIMKLTQPLCDALHTGNLQEFERLARLQIGSHTLLHNSLEMVLAGKTTIAEAMSAAVQD